MMTEGNEVKLNPEQILAVEAMMEFLADPDPDTNFFVLEGFAGTGKTFCMREVLARVSQSRMKFIFTAPTNKAAKVLKAIVGEAGTIYSALGLRIDKSGELKKLTTGEKPADLSQLDGIVVDESSMLTGQVINILREQTRKYHVKVIFMGDIAQLPPVGEPVSPIWNEDASRSKLSKVMRHDNQILTLVTQLRVVMNSITPSIKIEDDNDGVQGVWKKDRNSFKKSIMEAAHEGRFADGVACKVIAWRNIRVAEYNDMIRFAIFGADAKPGFYLAGEKVVATSPCVRGDETLLTTDEEAVVEGVQECLHPLEKKYKALELRARTEYNKVIRLLVIHPDSATQFNNDCEAMAFQARTNPGLWKKFWNLKELFHEVKYAYAITAHRSQGSTYESVWVDYQDILLNRNRKEAFQCLYVACSRPTTRLILA